MATRALLVVLLVTVTSSCGGGRGLSKAAFEKDLETIQSAAAEGALLAHDVAEDRTTAAFARVHSNELAMQARGAATNLGSAEAGAALEGGRRRAERMANAVAEDLERIGTAARDEAYGIALRLEAAAKAAERLAR